MLCDLWRLWGHFVQFNYIYKCMHLMRSYIGHIFTFVKLNCVDVNYNYQLVSDFKCVLMISIDFMHHSMLYNVLCWPLWRLIRAYICEGAFDLSYVFVNHYELVINCKCNILMNVIWFCAPLYAWWRLTISFLTLVKVNENLS
jgi:hypothetical protein